MSKQYRLTARAQINGSLCEPGHIFTLEDGERGPHRTVVASGHGSHPRGSPIHGGGARDEPLYVEVVEPKTPEPVVEAEPEPVAATDEYKPSEAD